ncbi:hypothetical protein V7193_10585, partial [Bacillus velezensis]
KSCQTDIESQLDHMNQKTAAEFEEKNSTKDTYYAYNTKNT